MRVCDAIAAYLSANGVTCAFGLPTAQISGFNDALNDYPIEYVVVKNEAAASYSAGRYAEVSGALGVCIIGGCVGVNNAINGIADAQRNKLPVLVLSSVVSEALRGKGALQELETVPITAPITKWCKTVTPKDDPVVLLKEALETALTPPFGPVHLSVPIDVQKSLYTGALPAPIIREHLPIPMDERALEDAAKLMGTSQRGLVVVGRGAKPYADAVRRLCEHLDWPLVTTPNAKGTIASDYKYHLGNYGWCTMEGACDYVDTEAIDTVLVLGSSLGQMATRAYNEALVAGRKVVHIDWDDQVFNRVFKADVAVRYPLEGALDKLVAQLPKRSQKFTKPVSQVPYEANHTGLSLRRFYEALSSYVPKRTCFIQDMGEHMNFAFKYLTLKEGMDYVTSIHYAAMGTAIGGAVGAYYADKSRRYVVLAGDGSFFMNGLEVLTAREYNCPIVYIVVNNSMLGLVEHGGEYVYGRRHKGRNSFKRVDIAKMCDAMGIYAIQIRSEEDFYKLNDAFDQAGGPVVVEVVTDGSEVLLDTDRWQKRK